MTLSPFWVGCIGGWLFATLMATAAYATTPTLPSQSQQIEGEARQLVNRWLVLLDWLSIDEAAYAPLLSSQPLEIQLPEGSASKAKGLVELLRTRFQSLSTSQHQIDFFRLEPLQNGQYRLRMELSWEGTNRDALKEIARLDETWLLERDEEGRLRIRQIQETYLPVQQGNGSRIKC